MKLINKFRNNFFIESFSSSVYLKLLLFGLVYARQTQTLRIAPLLVFPAFFYFLNSKVLCCKHLRKEHFDLGFFSNYFRI